MFKTILFRPDQDNQEEYQFLNIFSRKTKEFYISTRRSCVMGGVIIGRYSVLPYYKELEDDLAAEDNALINSYEQHRWIANFEYYDILKNHTFETWKQRDLPQLNYDGPFVVKGCTNSKKHQWNTRMFAKDKRTAIEIGCELKNDMLLGSQELLYRKYEPLKTFEIGVNGMRFTNEWRVFCYKNTILSYGYYWTGAAKAEEYNNNNYYKTDVVSMAKQLMPVISPYVNFYVMDLAQREDGVWRLVELNDGQMSGLSMNDPEQLYNNLNREIDNDKVFH